MEDDEGLTTNPAGTLRLPAWPLHYSAIRYGMAIGC